MADVDLRKWAGAKLGEASPKPQARLPLAEDVEIAPGVVLPAGHEPGMRVPKGGSSCDNCRYVDKRTGTCTEANFVAWNGSDDIPSDSLLEYCSDWWQPAAP